MLELLHILEANKKAIEFFLMGEWHFATDNTDRLFMEVDQTLFNFDVKHIFWNVLLEEYWAGIQQYILK